jgi:hypothetical protein
VKATVTAGLMCAPEKVSGGVDHDHDDQPEDESDADGAEHAVVVRISDDRAGAREHEREGGEALCCCATTDAWTDVVQTTQSVSIDKCQFNRYM